jgi:hypothetical protein
LLAALMFMVKFCTGGICCVLDKDSETIDNEYRQSIRIAFIEKFIMVPL